MGVQWPAWTVMLRVNYTIFLIHFFGILMTVIAINVEFSLMSWVVLIFTCSIGYIKICKLVSGHNFWKRMYITQRTDEWDKDIQFRGNFRNRIHMSWSPWCRICSYYVLSFKGITELVRPLKLMREGGLW